MQSNLIRSIPRDAVDLDTDEISIVGTQSGELTYRFSSENSPNNDLRRPGTDGWDRTTIWWACFPAQ